MKKTLLLLLFLIIPLTIFSQNKYDIDLMVFVKDLNFNSKSNKPLTYWMDNGERIIEMKLETKSYIGLIKYVESQGYELQSITEGTSGMMNVQSIGTKFWFRKID
jgi:hypothetical protein